MHQTDIRDADMDAAESFAVTVSEDKTARVWALENGKESAVLRFQGPGMRGALEAVAVTPQGTQVALGGYEGSIYLFDSSNWRLVRTIAPRRGTIHQLRYSRDGKMLAVGFHGSGGLSVFETQGYTPVFDAVDIDGDIYGLAFNSLGQLAVSAWDRTVRLYSEKYRLLAKQEFSSRPYRVAFDPSGKHLVVGFTSPSIAELPQLGFGCTGKGCHALPASVHWPGAVVPAIVDLMQAFEPRLPPLTTGPDGVIRVAGTRVSFETVVYAFDAGSSAEEIVEQYPTVSLSAVYAVISYMLDNRQRGRRVRCPASSRNGSFAR